MKRRVNKRCLVNQMLKVPSHTYEERFLKLKYGGIALHEKVCMISVTKSVQFETVVDAMPMPKEAGQ